ncbi:adenine deaminase [Loxospora ochrophaea]|nr:adenine deaminase [Loxospora ochrophaea]
MCKSPLHPLLASLPKCEHHIHLEGALTPSLLFALSARNSIPLPSPTTDPAFTSPTTLLARYTHFASLDDFLSYYYASLAVLLHAQDFTDLAWSYFTTAHAQGVVHAEVFFDPQAHTARGVPFATVLTGYAAACDRARHELGLSVELILCFLRHLPVADSLACFEEARTSGAFTAPRTSSLLPPDSNNTAEPRPAVIGIGLDSSELAFPPSLFAPLYTAARAHHLQLTAHAGEEGPASYVRSALADLQVSRIDHGVRIADDASLLSEIARRRILVTLCPLSNVRLQVVGAVNELPVRTFLDAGVRFSVNSDDPAYFGGYVLENWCAVQEAFGLSVAEWRGIAEAGVQGSWCGEGRKGEVMREIGRVVGEWEGRGGEVGS